MLFNPESLYRFLLDHRMKYNLEKIAWQSLTSNVHANKKVKKRRKSKPQFDGKCKNGNVCRMDALKIGALAKV